MLKSTEDMVMAMEESLMGTGRRDLNHSHRGYNEECVFWIRNESESMDLSDWVMNHKIAGYFSAKEVSDLSNRGNNTAGLFYSDMNNQRIETTDDVEDIRKGCVVKYLDKLWIVTDVSASKHNHQSFYNKIPEYKYIISLRR